MSELDDAAEVSTSSAVVGRRIVAGTTRDESTKERGTKNSASWRGHDVDTKEIQRQWAVCHFLPLGITISRYPILGTGV